MSKPPVDKAIDAVGSLTELARRLGVDPQVVVNWRKRGIPVDKVPSVEQATVERDAQSDQPVDGGEPKVKRHELRPDKPDLFPPPPSVTGEHEERATA